MGMMLALFNYCCMKAYRPRSLLFLWRLCVTWTHLLLVGWLRSSRLDSPTCWWVAGGQLGWLCSTRPSPCFEQQGCWSSVFSWSWRGLEMWDRLLSPRQTFGHACCHFIGWSRFHSASRSQGVALLLRLPPPSRPLLSFSSFHLSSPPLPSPPPPLPPAALPFLPPLLFLGNLKRGTSHVALTSPHLTLCRYLIHVDLTETIRQFIQSLWSCVCSCKHMCACVCAHGLTHTHTHTHTHTRLKMLDYLRLWIIKKMTSVLSNASGEKNFFFLFYAIICSKADPECSFKCFFSPDYLVQSSPFGNTCRFPCHSPALVYIKMDHLLRQTSKPESALSYKWSVF